MTTELRGRSLDSALCRPQSGAMAPAADVTQPSPLDRLLARGRPAVMGILNVTPDSFSDGGTFLDAAAAVAHAERMAAEGADILDVGAESTRPYGSMRPVTLEDEIARLTPVLPWVVGLGLPVSIDTIKAKVAAFALDAGAAIVNDVWGLQRDPEMARVVAERGCPVIVMHNRDAADPAIDIMADVAAFFSRSLDIAGRAGIARERIVLDPGIGFGKTHQHNLTLLANCRRFHELGSPLVVGHSRKGFIGKVLGEKAADRAAGTVGVALSLGAQGVQIIRVHDVRPVREALILFEATGGIDGRARQLE